jgi:hypothetical protein
VVDEPAGGDYQFLVSGVAGEDLVAAGGGE